MYLNKSARRLVTFVAVFLVLLMVTALNFPSQVLAAASYSLSPATKTVNVGDSFSVDILLDTGGDAVAGATAILTYDTTKLLVVDGLSGTDTASQGINITPGSVFNTEPLTNTVDSSTGEIRYDSGSLGTTYNSNGGKGVMATMTFKAVAEGTASVNFVYDSESTIDTSLVAAASGPVNLLSSVNNGTYTITTTAQAPLPATGTLETTLIVLVGGAALLLVGAFIAGRAVVAP